MKPDNIIRHDNSVNNLEMILKKSKLETIGKFFEYQTANGDEGEIDLIMYDKRQKELIFVEMKTSYKTITHRIRYKKINQAKNQLNKIPFELIDEFKQDLDFNRIKKYCVCRDNHDHVYEIK